MNHKVTLLQDDDYDLDDDIAPEYDLAKLPRATEQERKYRAQAQRRVVQLDADVLEFFKINGQTLAVDGGFDAAGVGLPSLRSKA